MTSFDLPARIFHATDRSARCDRALARAAALSRDWQAKLQVAHVVHPADVEKHATPPLGQPAWYRAEPWNEIVQRRLAKELAAEGVEAVARVVVGAPSEAVREAAVDAAAELVVLGVAKDAGMARVQLGSTVDDMVRRARVPVLNVRRRVRGAYGHVIVATDFSAPALHALQLAARWFEGSRLTLFHAYSTVAASLDGVLTDDESRSRIEQVCEEHLRAAALAPRASAALEVILEVGQPAALLAEYVCSTDADLVVLGSRGRSGVARMLLGSTAEQLLHSLDCDTLVVR